MSGMFDCSQVMLSFFFISVFVLMQFDCVQIYKAMNLQSDELTSDGLYCMLYLNNYYMLLVHCLLIMEYILLLTKCRFFFVRNVFEDVNMNLWMQIVFVYVIVHWICTFLQYLSMCCVMNIKLIWTCSCLSDWCCLHNS